MAQSEKKLLGFFSYKGKPEQLPNFFGIEIVSDAVLNQKHEKTGIRKATKNSK